VRRTAAHVPPEIRFATKPKLAVGMIERAITAGMPFAWVAADSVYGVGEIEMTLRRAGKGYVLGSTPTASSIPGHRASRGWHRRGDWPGARCIGLGKL
jgi:SRSO17 transposase